MSKTKFVSVQILLSVLILSTQVAQGFDMSINGSSPIQLSEDVEYDISQENIQLYSTESIVCHTKLPNPGSGLTAEVIDPNGDGKILPILDDVGYDIAAQLINVELNNDQSVCVAKSGTPYSDLIFRSNYESYELRYEGLSSQVVRGQTVDYKIVVENITDTSLNFDLVEYVPKSSINNPAFFESVDEWNCISHGIGSVDCNEDNVDNVLVNAFVPFNGSAEIEVSRTVSGSSTLGQSVEVLTALFVKNLADEIVDVIVINHLATVVDNSAPSISWVGNPLVAFIEDDIKPETVNFVINDGTGVNLDPSYLATVINDNNDKLMFSNIIVTQNSPTQHNVSFDVLPAEDQFTSAGNQEQINVQVQDIFGEFSNPLILDVTIDPVNDAPSFEPACLDFTINTAPEEITCNVFNPNVGNQLSVNWSYTDFITQISAGGVNNGTESGQSVIFEVLPVSGIITQGSANITLEPGTFVINDLLLSMPEGIYGTGSFRIRALDNGTPNNEVDVCPAVSPGDHCSVSDYSNEIVFEILEPVYFVGGSIDDLPDSDEIGIRLYEAGTNTPLGGTLIIGGLGSNGGQQIDFDYPQPLSDGQAYDVAITLPPSTRSCSITNGDTGVISGSNVSNVVIDCEPL